MPAPSAGRPRPRSSTPSQVSNLSSDPSRPVNTAGWCAARRWRRPAGVGDPSLTAGITATRWPGRVAAPPASPGRWRCCAGWIRHFRACEETERPAAATIAPVAAPGVIVPRPPVTVLTPAPPVFALAIKLACSHARGGVVGRRDAGGASADAHQRRFSVPRSTRAVPATPRTTKVYSHSHRRRCCSGGSLASTIKLIQREGGGGAVRRGP